MSKLSGLWNFFGRHKIIVALAIVVGITVFLDPNGYWNRRKHLARQQELHSQIEEFRQKYRQDSIDLEKLNRNDGYELERIARERYKMTRPNEDIFVIERK